MRARIIDIVAIACDMSGIDPALILSATRLRYVARIRQACYLIAREHGHSFPEIGRRMNRDHSSVIHGCEQAEMLFARDADCARFVENLRERCLTYRPFSWERLMRGIPLEDAKPLIPDPEDEPAVKLVRVAEPDPLPGQLPRRAKPLPPEVEANLDDMELLSLRISTYYAEARAA